MNDYKRLIEIANGDSNEAKILEAVELIIRLGAEAIEDNKLIDEFITMVIMSDNVSKILTPNTRKNLCDISDKLRDKGK